MFQIGLAPRLLRGWRPLEVLTFSPKKILSVLTRPVNQILQRQGRVDRNVKVKCFDHRIADLIFQSYCCFSSLVHFSAAAKSNRLICVVAKVVYWIDRDSLYDDRSREGSTDFESFWLTISMRTFFVHEPHHSVGRLDAFYGLSVPRHLSPARL